MAIGDSICPLCGDYSAVRVACTAEQPTQGCDGSTPRPHVHAICTKCKAEWIEGGYAPEPEPDSQRLTPSEVEELRRDKKDAAEQIRDLHAEKRDKEKK